MTEGQDHSLADCKLHEAMSPLEPWKKHLTIFQGLSGKMCRGSRNAAFGALGAYVSGGNSLPPRMETIDGALAKALGGVFPHLGFVMHDTGASVAYPPLSALGPNQRLPFYADPMLAYQDLFGTIATRGQAKASLDIDRNVLDFMIADVRRFQKRMSPGEKDKVDHYLHGFEALQKRQQKLASMSKTLAEQIAGLAKKLAAVPEGDGTMLDNTVILYLSDHGDRHHSRFHEWPMVALGNISGHFRPGRYVQFPGYGSKGHRTIGSLYTSLLYAAGHPRESFGQKDLQLGPQIRQTGLLDEWLA